MAKLDDPQLQSDLVAFVKAGDKLGVASRKIGLSRQAVNAYLRKHEELREEVEIARRRSHVIDTHALHPPPSLDAVGMGAGSLTPAGRDAFIALLEHHAADGGSRGCAKALDILAQLHLAREFMELKAEARRTEAERATENSPSSNPVVVRMPARRPRPAQILDAEIVDRSSDVG